VTPPDSVAILIPTLRPLALAAVVASAREHTQVPHTILVLCSPGDRQAVLAAEQAGALALVVAWQPGAGDYGRKINHGCRRTSEAWIFTGADDIRFHPGWDREALAAAAATGAQVVGTNDLHTPTEIRGENATHSLVSRRYAELGTVDEPGLIYHEGYDHQFVDNELKETACARGLWTFADRSHVEHLHPHWGLAEMDATYEKAHRATNADHHRFLARRPLWASS
jgi:hypothetical protein